MRARVYKGYSSTLNKWIYGLPIFFEDITSSKWIMVNNSQWITINSKTIKSCILEFDYEKNGFFDGFLKGIQEVDGITIKEVGE